MAAPAGSALCKCDLPRCPLLFILCAAAAGRGALGGPSRSRVRDFKDFEPELAGHSDTDAGVFEVWRFPLEFNNYIFYMRRFGVDVPVECAEGQPAAPCPLLVDFHGSYDSLYSQRAWTQWYKYQTQTKSKFILLTPEGSPDALYRPTDILTDCNDTSDDCIGQSGTSWNVLGWGDLSSPMPENYTCRDGDSQDNVYANCFWSTLNPAVAYQCFGTHLVTEPDVCRRTTTSEEFDQIPTVCMSASGANDTEYLGAVLTFVLTHYSADSRRIYFTGQSMGGMASLDFAAPEGPRSLPEQLRPAAVAPCSAGASRSRFADLKGQVPAMLMWGYTDHIAPATVWQGYNRNLTRLSNTSEFALLLRNSSLKQTALKVVGVEPHQMCSNAACSGKLCCMLLQANLMTGGQLLKDTAVHLAFDLWGRLGCENTLGHLTSIGAAGFLWEGLASTLQGIAGHPVDFRSLVWAPPAGVPKAAQKKIDILCAPVVADGPAAEVRVCVFNGGHTYPWNGHTATDDGHDWMDVAGPHGKVFHDFVWEDFLRGGKILRPCAGPSNLCHIGGGHATEKTLG